MVRFGALRAIERKIRKLREFVPASRHDLLVYDDTPLPAVDRRKVIAALTPWARELKSSARVLGRISIVISLDVLFDVGGESRILPYVQWSAPDLDDTPVQSFSERVELAGKVAVERAIREPSEDRRIPVIDESCAGLLRRHQRSHHQTNGRRSPFRGANQRERR